MADIKGTVDKIISVLGEFKNATITGTFEKQTNFTVRADYVANVTGTFGVGFTPFTGYYVVDKNNDQIVDKNGFKIII